MAKKPQMTKKERVLATFNFKDTDRVPVYDIIMHDGIIEHFTGAFPPVGREGLKLKCKTIAAMLDMTRMVSHSPRTPQTIEEDGFIRHYGRWLDLGIEKRPFSDVDGAAEWLKRATDKLRKENRDFDAASQSKKYSERFNEWQQLIGDDTVIIRESGTGLDDVRNLLGIETFCYVDADCPGLITDYLDAATELEVRKIHAIVPNGQLICALTYGDIAMKGSLLHSPEWLRREFIPQLKRLNTAWHSYGIKCLFHSDGYLMDIMDDLVASGIDGINPIETVAGMSVKKVREKYPSLFLTGGIDISELMPHGTREEVRAECEKAIAAAKKGYFIGSTTELDGESKTENILAMLETAWNTPVNG